MGDTPRATSPGSRPFQGALAPGIAKSDDQDEDEDDDLKGSEQSQLIVGGSYREQEYRLDVEDDKDEGVNVILDLELDPRIADGLNTTLVSLILERIWLLGAQKPVDDHWRKGENR